VCLWQSKVTALEEAPCPLEEWEAKTVMSDWQGRWQSEQGTALEEMPQCPLEEWEAETVISDWQGRWQAEQGTTLEEAL
jgi:Zn/Cd-binding protein ZinT